MIYVTGDCHADFSKFSSRRFPEQKEMTRQDTVIVCGDFGIWHDDENERERLAWLSGKPFTTLFVDGNHENFDRLYSDEFETVEIYGGKAHKIRDGIYHLKRGNVFTIEGKKFFAFGGARSHDISDGILDRADYKSDASFETAVYLWTIQGRMFRVNHISWWEREMPDTEEMLFGNETLKKHGYKVDYIISHCCPSEIAAVNGYKETDPLTGYFNTVAQQVSFDKWFFGHYHDNKVTYTKYVCLYDRIERIE